MRKILFSLFAVAALSSTYNAQQKISFESSEGYTLGTLSGQQGWEAWGGIDDGDTKVVNTTYTDGVNSMFVESWGDVMDYCGVEKNITSLTSNKYSVSFDYKIEDTGGSDYEIDFYNKVGTTYNIVAAFGIGYQAGAIKYANMSTSQFANSGINATVDTWYNLKIIVDKTLDTIEYQINGTSVGTSPLGANKDVNLIDFTFDDYGTGFNVDNILMSDLTLSTDETKTKAAISVYPNPTSDFISILTDDKVNGVQIFDASGKLVVKSNGDKKIDVRNLQKGSYIINIETPDSKISKKFIKK